MSTVFYDHLIDWEKIERALQSLSLSKEEHLEVLELIEESLHTEVLMVICTHIPKDHHEEFLGKFHTAPHDASHLDYLRMHAVSDIEAQIRLRSLEVIEEFIEVLERYTNSQP
jgi:mannitol/fructose-specific phosphotransferase system IIA component